MQPDHTHIVRTLLQHTYRATGPGKQATPEKDTVWAHRIDWNDVGTWTITSPEVETVSGDVLLSCSGVEKELDGPYLHKVYKAHCYDAINNQKFNIERIFESDKTYILSRYCDSFGTNITFTPPTWMLPEIEQPWKLKEDEESRFTLDSSPPVVLVGRKKGSRFDKEWHNTLIAIFKAGAYLKLQWKSRRHHNKKTLFAKEWSWVKVGETFDVHFSADSGSPVIFRIPEIRFNDMCHFAVWRKGEVQPPQTSGGGESGGEGGGEGGSDGGGGGGGDSEGEESCNVMPKVLKERVLWIAAHNAMVDGSLDLYNRKVLSFGTIDSHLKDHVRVFIHNENGGGKRLIEHYHVDDLDFKKYKEGELLKEEVYSIIPREIHAYSLDWTTVKEEQISSQSWEGKGKIDTIDHVTVEWNDVLLKGIKFASAALDEKRYVQLLEPFSKESSYDYYLGDIFEQDKTLIMRKSIDGIRSPLMIVFPTPPWMLEYRSGRPPPPPTQVNVELNPRLNLDLEPKITEEVLWIAADIAEIENVRAEVEKEEEGTQRLAWADMATFDVRKVNEMVKQDLKEFTRVLYFGTKGEDGQTYVRVFAENEDGTFEHHNVRDKFINGGNGHKRLELLLLYKYQI